MILADLLFKKINYDKDKTELENEIPDTSGVVKKTDYNTEITEIESQIPSISGLATNVALTTVENKIPNISSLVKKTDCNTKIIEVEKKLTDIIMTNILLLQSLILWLLEFLMQD